MYLSPLTNGGSIEMLDPNQPPPEALVGHTKDALGARQEVPCVRETVEPDNVRIQHPLQYVRTALHLLEYHAGGEGTCRKNIFFINHASLAPL